MFPNLKSKRKTGSAMLAILAITAVAVGSACAGSAPKRFEGEWPRGVDRSIPGVTGSLELQLFSRGEETMFGASGRAEGDGLADNALYSLWLEDQQGNALSLDTGRADQECDVDPLTGEEEDCELVVQLGSNQYVVPFGITTLEGLTLGIRQGLGTIGTVAGAAPAIAARDAEIVLEFTVDASDL